MSGGPLTARRAVVAALALVLTASAIGLALSWSHGPATTPHYLEGALVPSASPLCAARLTRPTGPARCGARDDALNVSAWNAMRDDLLAPAAYASDREDPVGRIPTTPTPRYLEGFFCDSMLVRSSTVGQRVATPGLRQALSDIWTVYALYYGWHEVGLPWSAMGTEGCFRVLPPDPGP